MTYEKLRQIAKTGDVIMLEGDGFFSKVIRVLTGQSISHVGALVWLDGGLFLAEFVEGDGYQLKPASERILSLKGTVYFGVAPKVVRDESIKITERVFVYRSNKNKQGYGYLSLIKVWWAQIIHKNVKVKQKVCSTFVQDLWETAGYKFKQTPDPGDFLRQCVTTFVLNKED